MYTLSDALPLPRPLPSPSQGQILLTGVLLQSPTRYLLVLITFLGGTREEGGGSPGGAPHSGAFQDIQPCPHQERSTQDPQPCSPPGTTSLRAGVPKHFKSASAWDVTPLDLTTSPPQRAAPSASPAPLLASILEPGICPSVHPSTLTQKSLPPAWQEALNVCPPARTWPGLPQL